MSSIKDLFITLGQRDIKLELKDGRLRLKAPKGAVTSELHAELAARKTEIITFLERFQNQPQEAIIIPMPQRNGDLPLSPGQRRLWFLERLNGPSGVYNLPIALRLKGALDVSLCGRILSEIVQRHEALRATFPEKEGMPVTVIQPANPVAVRMVDASHESAEARARFTEELLANEGREPFNQTQGPLYRASLLRLGRQEWVFVLTLHHMVADGWSLGVLVREFTALYQAFIVEKPSPLPPLQLQYVDYAAWLNRRTAGPSAEKALAFWREHLAGAPAVLALPHDGTRGGDTSVGGIVRFSFDPAVSSASKELNQSLRTTHFMIVSAAFAALLARYSRQNDVVLGMPSAGRENTGLRSLIGMFANTLATRYHFEDDPNFTHLLERTRNTMLQAQAHAWLPFEKIVEALAPSRDGQHSPIFQVMIAQ